MSYTPTTWNTGDTITAAAMNKIENGIANAGGGKYDTYDFIIKGVDSATPTVEKGSWQGVFDTLQDMEPVTGLLVINTTPGTYGDTTSLFIPFTHLNYYSSMDVIFCTALAFDISGNSRKIRVDWYNNGTIEVNYFSVV